MILIETCEIQGANIVNYMLASPKDAEPWIFHELYGKLKFTLLKMVCLDEASLFRVSQGVCGTGPKRDLEIRSQPQGGSRSFSTLPRHCI